MEKKENEIAGREIKISRLFNAPIDLMWEVWTNPEHIKNWWGPNGFTNTIHVMDVKTGGAWHLVMHGPDGTNYDNKSVFTEIIPHQKIVYRHSTWPQFTSTVVFEAQGDNTLITWQMLFESRELLLQVVEKHKADEGIKQNAEKLAAYLNKQLTNGQS